MLYLDNGTVTYIVGDDINMTFNVTSRRAQWIDMLHPHYNYTVRMAAVTNAGIGPFSAPVTATTLEDGTFKYSTVIILTVWYLLLIIVSHIYTL